MFLLFFRFLRSPWENIRDPSEIHWTSLQMASSGGFRSFQNPFNSKGLHHLGMGSPWMARKSIDFGNPLIWEGILLISKGIL